MEKILVFLAKETKGICYKSFEYCFESIEVPFRGLQAAASLASSWRVRI